MPDVKQYLDELLSKAGVAEDKRQALMTTLGDDQVAKALEDDYLKGRLRQDEFSRKMDELAAKEKKNNDWYAEELVVYNKSLAAKAEYEAALARINAGETPIPSEPKFVQTPADAVSKKDFDERIAQMERQSISIIKGVGKITGDHWEKFGKAPDLDAIEKIAAEQNLSLDNAYKTYIEPRLREKNELTAKEQVDKRVEERLREELSKRHLPIDSKPREFHALFDREKELQPGSARPTQAQLREGFAQSWNESAGK